MEQNIVSHIPTPFKQTYFHGTKADLQIGDLIQVGFQSNYEDRALKHVYVSATLNAALLGAELAKGDGPERIYIVESMGTVENDPNVTDKKFPGNPTMSFRSEEPFKARLFRLVFINGNGSLRGNTLYSLYWHLVF